MEDEIDLRAYIEVLLRHWIWIVGLAVGAAAVAFVYISLQPDRYRARSVVIVTQPRYQMQFDPRFETTNSWRPAAQAFPTLATSDDILQHVVDGYTPSPEAKIEAWSLATLSGMVEASSEGDPSLVVLQVTSRSARDAAGIANVWARALVARADAIYGATDEEFAFFEARVADAEQTLKEAETALVEFQARNQAGTINAQLASLRQAQADYLAAQRGIAYIDQDIRGLRQQLAEQSGSQPVSLGDSLTALFLQIKAFNAQSSTTFQIQVDDPGAFSDKTPAEQVAFLDGLVARLEAKSAEIDDRLVELEPQTLDLQQRQQEVYTESDRLTRARDLAHETYMTLSRKLDEVRIAAQEESGVLVVGSLAAVPMWPVGSRRLLLSAAAGFLGLIAGVLCAFFIEFWRRGEPSRQHGQG